MPELSKDDQHDRLIVTPKSNQLPSIAPILDQLSIKKASLVFRAINHPMRQDMIKMIDEKGHVTVTEIFVEMRLEQSVASQHLAILRRAGIVVPERDGKFVYYKLNADRLRLLNQMISDLLN
jgi:DNA-binding transcriptional ArsR family regulator